MGAKTMLKTGAPSGTKKMAYNWQMETLISRLAPLLHEVDNSNNKIVVVDTNETDNRKRSHATATSI